MLIAAALLVCIATVPIAGGRLGYLADLELRHRWTLPAAFGLQLTIVYVIPHWPGALLETGHMASYGFAAWFLWANRRVPGLMIIALGGLSNFVAIAVNGGVMPASRAALAMAGLEDEPGQFASSVPVGNAKLQFLGDIFAVPASWPVHNVFSVGDVCIVVGAFVLVHKLGHSALFRPSTGDFRALVRNGAFVRVWGAQAVSNLGDWMYTLAVVTTLAGDGAGAGALAGLLLAQVAPAAVAGALGGQLVDRLPRKVVMIGCHAVSATAVVVAAPRRHSLARPLLRRRRLPGGDGRALQAERARLAAEHRARPSRRRGQRTPHRHLPCRPDGGPGARRGDRRRLRPRARLRGERGLVRDRGRVALRGADAAPRAHAGLRAAGDRRELPACAGHPPDTRRDDRDRPRDGRGLDQDAARALVRDADARREPAGPRPARRRLGDGHGAGVRPRAAARPALASRVAHRMARSRWSGACVMASALARSFNPVLAYWAVAGVANAVAVISYQSLLQERTPDRLRGRVVAASEAVLDASLIVGALTAGSIGALAGIRGAFAISGAIFIGTALLARLMLGQGQPVSQPAAKQEAEPAEATPAAAW